MGSRFGLTQEESKILSRLNTPKLVQKFLDDVECNLEERGKTCYSPRRVLRERKANCIEGAIFAAAALRFHGHPPLIVDLASVRDDDHVVAVFKCFGHWGAVAKSKYTGLGYREPIHQTIRELAVSYFEDYFNFAGEKTLREYSRPINLARFDNISWMTTEDDLFSIAEHLAKISHRKLFTVRAAREFRRVTSLAREAGELGMAKTGILKRVRAGRRTSHTDVR